jgi:hypothetical protein
VRAKHARSRTILSMIERFNDIVLPKRELPDFS